MELNDAIATLEKENKWYYQDEGKSVMVNNSALHEAISTVLSHLKTGLPSGVKLYRCSNCQTINAKIDNGEIRVGFCDKCEHPLWNPVKKNVCPYCSNPNPHLYGDEGGYCEECNKDWKNDTH